MGFEPTTLRGLFGCSATELLETLWCMVSKGQIVGIDWNCIAWLHSHVLAHMNSLTASRCLTLAHHRVSSSSVVEHPTKSRRVVGSNPIWDSDFFSESTCLLEFT